MKKLVYWIFIMFQVHRLYCEICTDNTFERSLLDEAPFKLSLDCIKNCKLNGFNEPVMQVKCEGVCSQLQYQWLIDSNTSQIIGETQNQMFTLNSSLTSNQEDFSVIVKASTAGKRSQATYNFRQSGGIQLKCAKGDCIVSNRKTPYMIDLVCDTQCPKYNNSKTRLLHQSKKQWEQCRIPSFACVGELGTTGDTIVNLFILPNRLDTGAQYQLSVDVGEAGTRTIDIQLYGIPMEVHCTECYPDPAKNNVPTAIIHDIIQFEAKCLKSCRNYNDNPFSWNIRYRSSKENAEFSFKTDTGTLALPRNTLDIISPVIVQVVKGECAVGSTEIRGVGCIIPESSSNQKQLKCEFPKTQGYTGGINVTLKLETDDSEKVIYVGLDDLASFALDTNTPSKLYIRRLGVAEQPFEIEFPRNPNPTPIPITTSTTTSTTPFPYPVPASAGQALEWAIMGVGDQSLASLVNASKFDEAIQATNALIQRIKNIPPEKSKKHPTRHVLSLLDTMAPKINPHEMLPILEEISKEKDPLDEFNLNLLGKSLYKTTIQKGNQYDDGMFLERVLNLTSTINDYCAQIPLIEPEPSQDQNEYPTYDEMHPFKLTQEQQLREVALSEVRLVTAIGKIAKDKGTLQSDNIVTTTVRLQKGSATSVSVKDSLSRVDVSKELARSISRRRSNLYLQVSSFKANPFKFEKNAKSIQTNVVMVSVFTDTEYIHDLKADIDIFLERKTPTTDTIIGNMAMNESLLTVHKILMKPHSRMNIVFKKHDNSFFFYISPNYPAIMDVRSKGTIIRNTAQAQEVTFFNDKDTILFMGLVRKFGHNVSYEIEISSENCVSWGDKSWEWSEEDCKIGKRTSNDLVHCQCKHLSLFGATIFVPPNKISIPSDVPLSVLLRRSFWVILFVLVILALWIICMLWAMYRDKALKTRTVQVLRDRIPGDENHYIVCVTTGWDHRASTTAHVTIQLLGEYSDSRVHLVEGSFFRGGEDWFILSTPYPLGNVMAVRMFHDAAGKRPHWFCERVTVQDPVNKRFYVFVARKWLSLTLGSGRVTREFQQTEAKDLKKGRTLFAQHTSVVFHDDYLWLSLFIRPPDSSFTTKERVMTVFSVFMLSLTASAMFYGVEGDLERDDNFGFALADLAIAVESLLVTVPLSTIIVLLFRRSRPREII